MHVPDETPVVVGAGQVLQRVDDVRLAREPIALMEAAARRAAEDAGAAGLLERIGSVRVPAGLWPYANPGAWLGERLGAGRVESWLGRISGTTVLELVGGAAAQIQAGQRDVVLVVGGECEHAKRRLAAQGEPPSWSDAAGPPLDRDLRGSFDARDPDIAVARLRSPAMVFALFEAALRHRSGEAADVHRKRIARLQAGMARVAAENPYAWIREAPDADAIATPDARNRLVVAPYTKWMVANMVVDQAAAVLLCSAATARRLGVPPSKWVYPLALARASAGRPVSERRELWETPAQAIAARALFEAAGVEPSAVGPVDLYSCFPSAVQLGQQVLRELGADVPAAPTLTGGLTFAGGPFNSYVLHALATLVERLRSDGSAPGLLSGVGGYMARHAFALFGRAPAPRGFRAVDRSDEAARLPGRALRRGVPGGCRVESAIAVHGRGGPIRAVAALRTPAGERAWAYSDDPECIAEITDRGIEGRAVEMGEQGWQAC